MVDDDVNVGNKIASFLRSDGSFVDVVDNGEEALSYAKVCSYDIVLVDIVMPGMDGHQMIKNFRRHGIDVPVTVISGISQTKEKVRAISSGADDFVTKPFDNDELLARIKAVVRRSRGFSHKIVQCGPLTLDTECHEASINGHQLHLTNKEYAMIELLVLRQGMMVTKEMFLNHLYGGLDEPEVKIIDVFVCKIRKKLSKLGAPESLLLTVWGKGYMIKNPNSKQKTINDSDVSVLEEILVA